MMAFYGQCECSYLCGVDILYDGGSVAAMKAMQEDKAAAGLTYVRLNPSFKKVSGRENWWHRPPSHPRQTLFTLKTPCIRRRINSDVPQMQRVFFLLCHPKLPLFSIILHK